MYDNDYDGDDDDWQDEVEYCLEHARGILKDHEVEFLENILDEWEGSLTEAQRDWLDALVDRVDKMLEAVDSGKPKVPYSGLARGLDLGIDEPARVKRPLPKKPAYKQGS